jgi:Fur family ferric uptake transcriptional regulator
MACEEIFLKRLRERGFRLTPQREMVLAVMHQVEGVATAEEIHAEVQALSSCVDISTVYRTLELLQEFQLVAVIDLGEGQRHYELLGVHGPHPHLLCRSCGKLIGVEQEEIQPLLDRLGEGHGFEVDSGSLTIPGLCQECQAARSDASS